MRGLLLALAPFFSLCVLAGVVGLCLYYETIGAAFAVVLEGMF